MAVADNVIFSDGTKHTFEEIANKLGISICAVNTRYYSDKNKLEDCYYGREVVISKPRNKYNYHGEILSKVELRNRLKCDLARLNRAIHDNRLESFIEMQDEKNNKLKDMIIIDGLEINEKFLYEKFGYELAKYRIELLGIKDAYLSLKYDIKPKEFIYAAFDEENNVIYTLDDAVYKLKRTKRTIAIFVKKNGIEKYHKLMKSCIEFGKGAKVNLSSLNKLNLNGVQFTSFNALASFINAPLSSLFTAYDNNRLEEFLDINHFKERLLFKDNSPYSTWFTDDTWIYECPICKRKLLMSTEELINYKHDDILCKEYEVEDMIDE